MRQQHLQFLGSIQVTWKEGTPPRFRSLRMTALLGYLAAEARPFSPDIVHEPGTEGLTTAVSLYQFCLKKIKVRRSAKALKKFEKAR